MLGLPLLVTLQLQLHAKQLNLQPLGLLDLLVDTTLMFLSATLLLVGMMLQLLSTLLLGGRRDFDGPLTSSPQSDIFDAWSSEQSSKFRFRD
jgi:hypothetical protein